MFQEVGCSLAHISTVVQHPDVLLLGMFTTCLLAGLSSLQTNMVAVHAISNTLLNFYLPRLVPLILSVLWHSYSPF
ncbi:MAG: hypothetical protein AUH05_22380 [Ktedonobacter sp. 13_2_20CM_53_11]|nr:MAG: hypothetical protein AUH05_22380 [Ktedonobacter sp. 13_2_20CM_53_11]